MIYPEIVGVATEDRERNPGTFLKGLRGSNRVSVLGICCPAKGQPLQESFGVLLLGRRYCLEGVTRSGRYTRLTAGITGWTERLAARLARAPGKADESELTRRGRP